MASSASAEYRALNKHSGGEADRPSIQDEVDDAPLETALIDDEVQVNLNTESDDEDYLQVELEDSYRPPSTSSSSSSGRSTRSLLLIGVLVTAIVLVLLILTVSVLVYGNTLLNNMRAASASWSNVLHTATDGPTAAIAPPSAEIVIPDVESASGAAVVPADIGDESTDPSYEAEYDLDTAAVSASSSAAASSSTSFSSSSFVSVSSSLASSSLSPSSSSPLSASSSASSSNHIDAPSSMSSAVQSSSASSASSVPSSASSIATFLTSSLASLSSSGSSSSGLQDKTAKPALLAHLASYVARHYSPDMTLDPERKYIVFTPTDDGLGNKVLPLISSFFLALVLDRTWLIHWVGTEAINNSKVKVEEVFRPPDGMDWSWTNIVERTKAKAEHTVQEEIGDQNVLFRTKLCDIAGLLGLSCSVIDMAGAGMEHAETKVGLSCADWRTEGPSADNLFVNWGDQYYVPTVQVNPHYRPFILEMFDEDDIFGPLARFLLRPSHAIDYYITDMQQRFWTNRYVVSMQLRRRERLGLHNAEVDTAVKCAKEMAVAGKAATGKEVTFFVASDDAQLRDDLVGRMQPEGQVVHVSNFSVREQQLGVFFAAIDVILLSRGDAIVTTPSSTFGYISAGFGSLIPRRVQLGGQDCNIAVNSEPSSHFFHAEVKYSQEHQPFCVDFGKFENLMKQEGCCPRW